jgi:hypothetical protein
LTLGAFHYLGQMLSSKQIQKLSFVWVCGSSGS